MFSFAATCGKVSEGAIARIGYDPTADPRVDSPLYFASAAIRIVAFPAARFIVSDAACGGLALSRRTSHQARGAGRAALGRTRADSRPRLAAHSPEQTAAQKD